LDTALPADRIPSLTLYWLRNLPFASRSQPGGFTLVEPTIAMWLASYRVVAVVRLGGSGNSPSEQRQFEGRTTVCKSPGGTAPRYGC
jgi:hypothetical protein